jgi:hypothetical protein
MIRGMIGAAARHDRTHLDHVVAAHHGVAGQELVVADDQDRAGQDVELDEELLDPAPAVQLPTSRLGSAG